MAPSQWPAVQMLSGIARGVARAGRLGLRARLLIALALIALPGIVLGLIGDYSALADERAELPDAERSLVQTVGGLVDSAVDQAIAVAWTIATEPSTRSLNPAIIDPRLRALATVYPQYDNIIVVDAQGSSVGEM
jgi:hypothetical protein